MQAPTRLKQPKRKWAESIWPDCLARRASTIFSAVFRDGQRFLCIFYSDFVYIERLKRYSAIPTITNELVLLCIYLYILVRSNFNRRFFRFQILVNHKLITKILKLYEIFGLKIKKILSNNLGQLQKLVNFKRQAQLELQVSNQVVQG